MSHTSYKAGLALTLWPYSPEMLGLNLGHDTDYSRMFLWFYSAPPDNFQNNTSVWLQPLSCVLFQPIMRYLPCMLNTLYNNPQMKVSTRRTFLSRVRTHINPSLFISAF